MEAKKMTQMERNNKVVVTSHAFVGAVISLAYILEIIKGNRDVPYVMMIILLAMVPAAIEFYLKKKNPETSAIKLCAGIGYGILYTVVIFTTEEGLAFVYALPMVVIFLVYADKKFSLIFNTVVVLENVIAVIVGANMHSLGYTTTASAEIRVLVLVIIGALGYVVTRTTMANDGMRIDDVMQEKQKTENVLNNIMVVSEGMTKGIDALYEKLLVMKESAMTTKDAMGEVMNGSNDTAQAVQQQLLQTQEIEHKAESVDRALQSIHQNMQNTKQVLDEGQRGIDVLVKQADASVTEGAKAAKELETLNNYISQMNSIVDIISGITSQTSLLALNASIEAARAGEAGKGFAVVASEISTMANQTDEATQKISTLIEDVSSAIENVVKVVLNMIEEINQERGLTEGTRGQFKNIAECTMEIERHMDQLTENINGLVHANREISDSIQTISSISEEVSAHSDTTYASQEGNIQVLEEISGITSQLKEYAANL